MGGSILRLLLETFSSVKLANLSGSKEIQIKPTLPTNMLHVYIHKYYVHENNFYLHLSNTKTIVQSRFIIKMAHPQMHTCV